MIKAFGLANRLWPNTIIPFTKKFILFLPWNLERWRCFDDVHLRHFPLVTNLKNPLLLKKLCQVARVFLWLYCCLLLVVATRCCCSLLLLDHLICMMSFCTIADEVFGHLYDELLHNCRWGIGQFELQMRYWTIWVFSTNCRDKLRLRYWTKKWTNDGIDRFNF